MHRQGLKGCLYQDLPETRRCELMHDDDKHYNDEQEDIVYQITGIWFQGFFDHVGLTHGAMNIQVNAAEVKIFLKRRLPAIACFHIPGPVW